MRNQFGGYLNAVHESEARQARELAWITSLIPEKTIAAGLHPAAIKTTINNRSSRCRAYPVKVANQRLSFLTHLLFVETRLNFDVDSLAV